MKRIEKVKNGLKKHFEEKLYVRVTRGYKKDFRKISTGYVMDMSDSFLLLKDVQDFNIDGFNIIPLDKIRKLRYNEDDKYFDFITKSEFNDKILFSKDFKINLHSWKSIFSKLKDLDKTIISECEKYKHGYFSIGKVNRVTDEAVYIDYFNAQGVLDKEPVEHKYKWITKVTFDDRYSKVFSKYLKK